MNILDGIASGVIVGLCVAGQTIDPVSGPAHPLAAAEAHREGPCDGKSGGSIDFGR